MSSDSRFQVARMKKKTIQTLSLILHFTHFRLGSFTVRISLGSFCFEIMLQIRQVRKNCARKFCTNILLHYYFLFEINFSDKVANFFQKLISFSDNVAKKLQLQLRVQYLHYKRTDTKTYKFTVHIFLALRWFNKFM